MKKLDKANMFKSCLIQQQVKATVIQKNKQNKTKKNISSDGVEGKGCADSLSQVNL